MTVLEVAMKAKRVWSRRDRKLLPTARASLPVGKGAPEAALEDETGPGWKGRGNS